MKKKLTGNPIIDNMNLRKRLIEKEYLPLILFTIKDFSPIIETEDEAFMTTKMASEYLGTTPSSITTFYSKSEAHKEDREYMKELGLMELDIDGFQQKFKDCITDIKHLNLAGEQKTALLTFDNEQQVIAYDTPIYVLTMECVAYLAMCLDEGKSEVADEFKMEMIEYCKKYGLIPERYNENLKDDEPMDTKESNNDKNKKDMDNMEFNESTNSNINNNNLTMLEDNLVSVYTTNTGEKVVYGRELWQVLGSKQDFSTWMKKRIGDCDAMENEDFEVFHKKMENQNGGRPQIEYIIKLDTAKEMAMLERNEKGKQVKQYLMRISEKPVATINSTEIVNAKNNDDTFLFKNNIFGEIRVILLNNEPWFVGKDIAIALGYENPTKAIRDHVDEEDKKMGVQNVTPSIKDNLGRNQYPTFINESGLYALIFSSKLPSAKQFKHWVTSEVLPLVQKTNNIESEFNESANSNNNNNKLAILEDSLVPVYITNTGEKVIYGRELWEILESKTEYNHWISRRLEECDAIENSDYEVFAKKDENSSGGRPSKDHIIKLDTAKEMAMLERNEKGKQVRRYFIEVEKRYKQSSPTLSELDQTILQIIHSNDVMDKAANLSKYTELVTQPYRQKVEELHTDNKLLSGETLDWGNKKDLNFAVRKLSYFIQEPTAKVWDALYQELRYKHGIDLRNRRRARGKKQIIDCVDNEKEWSKLMQSFSAICEAKDVSPTQMFEDKVDRL